MSQAIAMPLPASLSRPDEKDGGLPVDVLPPPQKAGKRKGKASQQKRRHIDPRNPNVSYTVIRTPDGPARLLTDSLPRQHPDEKTTIAPEHMATCACTLGGRHASGGVMEVRARENGRPALCVNCAADAAYEREQALAELLGIRGDLYEHVIVVDSWSGMRLGHA